MLVDFLIEAQLSGREMMFQELYLVTFLMFPCFSAIEDFSDAVLRYPYKVNNAGRYKRDCEHNAYRNTTNVKFIAHGRKESDSSKTSQPEVLTLPIVESHTSTVTVNQHMYNERNVLIHVAYIHNPVKTVSVYEPLHDGTCNSNNLTRATVQASSEYRHCLLASNAGLFNTKTGGCYGNIVSDGRLVQDSEGIENAHFGITKDGHLFFGYLSEIDVIKENFVQLVGGVIWVLKDGEPYIDQSIASECRDTEETGTLQMFASVISARTLVGHDDKGRVMILQIDGKTGSFGANLYEAASILKDLGAINAINLDGGGSSTYVINNTVVNHPSDKCGNFNCAREVSSILCVHEPFCKSPDCGGHGTCDLGVCHCHGHWKGINCETLQCPGSCSGHGECSEEGCVCFPGYHGDNCSTPCAGGWYGDMCLQRCQCENNSTCDSVIGSCKCLPGYMGHLCQYRCKLGFYGDQCSEICECKDTCLCDPETGACNYTFANEDYLHAGSCFQKKLQEKRDIEVDMLEQYKGAIFTVIISTVIAFLSIVLNFILICKYCVKCCPRRRTKQYKSSRPSSNGLGKTYELQGKKFSGFMSSSNEEELESSIIEKQSLLPS